MIVINLNHRAFFKGLSWIKVQHHDDPTALAMPGRRRGRYCLNLLHPHLLFSSRRFNTDGERVSSQSQSRQGLVVPGSAESTWAHSVQSPIRWASSDPPTVSTSCA